MMTQMSDTPTLPKGPSEPTPDEQEAARLAGWNTADGPAPYAHALPPENDPNLGNNGIPPTDSPRVA